MDDLRSTPNLERKKRKEWQRMEVTKFFVHIQLVCISYPENGFVYNKSYSKLSLRLV